MIPDYIMYRLYEEHKLAVVMNTKTNHMLLLQKDYFRFFKKTLQGHTDLTNENEIMVHMFIRSGLFLSANSMSRLGPDDALPHGSETGEMDNGYMNALSLWAFKNIIPLAGHFEVTRRCNMNCRHCFALLDNTQDVLNTQDVFSIIDNLEACGAFFLVLTGGEFFMRHDAVAILDYLFQRRFLVRINTNATLINETLADDLVKYSNIRYHISLYGASSKVHDSITRSPGSFVKTVRAIDLLKSIGQKIRINSVIMKENFEDILKLKEMADGWRLPLRFDADLYPKDDGSFMNTQGKISPEQRKGFDQFMAEHDPSFIKRLYSEKSLCRAGYSFFYITYDGQVHPCPKLKSIPLGNVKTEPFSKIWYESDAVTNMRKPLNKHLLVCESICNYFI